MTEICKKEDCTGCWACINSCLHGAISMKEGKLGHLYPYINSEKCIDCGLCVKVCPANNPHTLHSPRTAYAGWDKNEEEYRSSTSGGAASALSRYIIRNSGIVYGCACLDNIDIRHVRIDNEDDLNRLKGSKYVQSSIHDSYRLVKNDLRNGLEVLFVGTPCQIAGLKSYLHKDYDNLYLVDLICHGVPSLAYLKQHAHNITHSKEISEVKFRDGNGMYLLLLLLRGKVLYKKFLWSERYKDTYFNTFMDGFTYRDSCYNCPYAKTERVSDITIGDFWGLKNDLPIPHPYGCSCVLPITPKGERLLENIKDNFHLFEREVREAVNGNEQLRHPKFKGLRIRAFRSIYSFVGISAAYRLLMLDKILRYNLGKLKRRILKQ